MPRASSERLHTEMKTTVNGMWAQLLSIIKIEMTYREAMALFLPKEDGDVLVKASKFAQNISPSNLRGDLGDAAPGFDILVYVTASLVPKRAWLQPPDNSRLRKRFDEWLAMRLQLGRDWGRVDEVLAQLVAQGLTPAQMRKRFPGIRAIWQSAPAHQHLADKYEAYNRNLRAPFLPGALAEAALLADTTLVTFTTLPRAEAAAPAPAVQLVHQKPNEPPMHEDPSGFRFAIR